MATNTARLDQLEKAVNTLLANERAMEVRLQMLTQADERAEAATTALREEQERSRQKQADADQRLIVTEATVKELKATTEKWGQRGWQLAAGVVLVLLGGISGWLLKR